MVEKVTRRWVIRDSIPPEIDQALAGCGYPPFFRQLLFSRGIQDEAGALGYLEGRLLSGEDHPHRLKDMEKTTARLERAIARQEPVAVYGDYDVDGVTATALLTQVLRAYGAQVIPYIPNRFDEGYGLNIEALDHLAASGVGLVITVDCGIRSLAEVEHAMTHGLDIIISDHHHPGPALPQAYAIVCPKQEGCGYPYKELAGVGLAYKIAQALALRMPEAGVQADTWLDLVAVGTVADVAPLHGENRVLVRRGLELMRESKMHQRPGLRSLAGVAGVKVERVGAGDIGFMLGPRLNAAGRLHTALASLELLLCETMDEAALIAQKLDDQNRDRQDLTRKTQADAIQGMNGSGPESILFAFHEKYNPGVVGLVASRLVETFYRPAVVGNIDGEFTRASCRSIPEFHITEALDRCADLLVRHGGHALAAGFTVRTTDLPELMRRLRLVSDEILGGRELCPVLHADQEIPLEKLRPELFRTFLTYLDRLQPTGQGNPEAVFVSRDLEVVDARAVGGERQHLKLRVRAGSNVFNCIAFREGHRLADLPRRIDLMYRVELNEYNGVSDLQLNVRDFKAAGQPD